MNAQAETLRSRIRHAPLTRRADLVRHQLARLPHTEQRPPGAPAPVRAGISGSGADLLVLTWTADDLARECAAGCRVLGRLGLAAGMRIANTLPGGLATPGSLLLGDVIEAIGGLDIPLGVVANDAAAHAAWELIDRVQPEVLVLDAASGPALLARTPRRRRDWWRGIVWLRSADAPPQPPSLPPGLSFAGWQRRWLAVAEVSSFVAGECAAGRFHVDAGLVTEVVEDDATGLVLTPRAGDLQLLRYVSGVAALAPATACDCGSPEPGIVII